MSLKNAEGRKGYWARMDPEERSARMRAIAIARQKKMTFKQKRDHALKMVEGRRRAARERGNTTLRVPPQSVV